MKCPFCHNEDTKVIDSRLNINGNEVKRRRQCPKCDARYTTYERREQRYPRVIKNNGNKELFDEHKIRRGIIRSLGKLNVDSEDIENIINRICDNLSRTNKDEINSSFVGEQILRELSKISDVAYIRFASVYRRFDNISDFTKELQKLKETSND